ncbi:MAG: RnfABCDGE type electron transport complex subunit D [Verrucomicrobia bacterium]|nr:RnfABCDGE type electron transport complex subunit D [Verrucomicrobiota bacterium]
MDAATQKPENVASAPVAVAPAIHIAPAPHLFGGVLTTRRMMVDVLLALVPVLVASLWMFRLYTVLQLAICMVSALVAETVFTKMRGRRPTLGDGSAVVTGAILAFSLPATAPWYVGFIGAFVAIGLGKIVFGGLGQNIFNPAMVGRAFVLIAFPVAMGASAYVAPTAGLDGLTQATPLTALKMLGQSTGLLPLFLGTTNGSLGETSALACLIGGLYLCARRTASWEIPAAAILAVAAISGLLGVLGPRTGWTLFHDLSGGAFLFGAFYIATDPVSSPLTPKGKWMFGAGFGALVMLIRRMSGYPEGVMFAVLIMNALVPLINRWAIPTPVGGPVPVKKTA